MLPLLKFENYFVIFCNFPIDETGKMWYHACMKKMPGRDIPYVLPRLAKGQRSCGPANLFLKDKSLGGLKK